VNEIDELSTSTFPLKDSLKELGAIFFAHFTFFFFFSFHTRAKWKKEKIHPPAKKAKNNLLPLREKMFSSPFLWNRGREKSGKVVCKFHQIKVERVIIMISEACG
jgi:hypothetical protein